MNICEIIHDRIKYVNARDKTAWYTLDKHLPASGFDEKVKNRQGYVYISDGRIVGILRYNLFWNNTPFCTMLFIDSGYRTRGYGKELMEHWERK